MSSPTTRSVLQSLSKARLLELARTFSVVVPPAGTKESQAEALVSANSVRFAELLAALGRDELKAACRTHGLDDSGRARPILAARLLQAHGAAESATSKPGCSSISTADPAQADAFAGAFIDTWFRRV